MIGGNAKLRRKSVVTPRDPGSLGHACADASAHDDDARLQQIPPAIRRSYAALASALAAREPAAVQRTLRGIVGVALNGAYFDVEPREASNACTSQLTAPGRTRVATGQGLPSEPTCPCAASSRSA